VWALFQPSANALSSHPCSTRSESRNRSGVCCFLVRQEKITTEVDVYMLNVFYRFRLPY